MDKKSETYLIEQCRRQDRKSQLLLYKQFAPSIYRTCYRILGQAEEAEEATQDTFLKIFTRLDSFRTDQCLEAWIRQIAVRTAIDRLRQATPQGVELTDEILHSVEEEENEPDEEQIAYTVSCIKTAMEHLPLGYRVILSLYLFEGFDTEEIAQILQIQSASVRSQYLRAKRKLIEILKK